MNCIDWFEVDLLLSSKVSIEKLLAIWDSRVLVLWGFSKVDMEFFMIPDRFFFFGNNLFVLGYFKHLKEKLRHLLVRLMKSDFSPHISSAAS